MLHEQSPLPGTIVQRFWQSIEKAGENQCWEWKKRTTRGYGFVSHGGSNFAAHRISYFIHYGPIPRDQNVICHSCDNTLCCNPKHLRAATPKDNVRDSLERGRFFKPQGSKHCQSKITEADVIRIRTVYALTKSPMETMRVTGFSKGLVTSAMFSWKHVPQIPETDALVLCRKRIAELEKQLAAIMGDRAVDMGAMRMHMGDIDQDGWKMLPKGEKQRAIREFRAALTAAVAFVDPVT